MSRPRPLRPLLIPAVLGAVTGYGLIAALLSNGASETIALVCLAGVVGVILARLAIGARRSAARRRASR